MTPAVQERASTEKVTKALTTQTEPTQGMTLRAMLKTTSVRGRFEELLGKKAAGFMSSIISVVSGSKYLESADPQTIIAAAAVAAALDLPINPSLGFAYIVPYKGKAQFQLGWKGFVQLAQRTGLYQTMNVSEVYEGQLVKNDPFTGLMQFNAEGKKSDKIIGYVAYFKLLTGFEKYAYATEEAIRAHAKKYSQSYESDEGQWKKNFPAMAKKTMVKGLLSKWAPMSVEIQKAITYDQAVVQSDETPTYPDGADAPIDVEAVATEKAAPGPWDFSVKVEGVTLTEAAGKEAWIVSVPRSKTKVFTDNKEIAELAGNAAKAGATFNFNATTKDGDKWITEASLG